MNEKMTCERFNEILNDYMMEKLMPGESAEMDNHLETCSSCREIYEMKKSLICNPNVEKGRVAQESIDSLVESVLLDVAEMRITEKKKTSVYRCLMPAMAAAIVVFAFLAGYMLGEMKNLSRENIELRDEVAALEVSLGSRYRSKQHDSDGSSILGVLAGDLQDASKGITVGEVVRALESIPASTPILTADEAERIISRSNRARRYAGYLDGRPWEDGLTSGEILTLIMTLDIPPETKIPERWRRSYSKRELFEDEI
jgi:hypothetical protein